jgi:predicted nucleic acid-binding protein
VVFADSSGFIAAFDARDQRHAAAARAWRGFADEGMGLVTTRLVFAETVTHLRRRAGWEASRKVGDALLRSRVIEIVGLTEEQLQAAWREFVRNADSKLSLADAASFVVMRDRGLGAAFTFDQLFAAAGFRLIP